MLQWGLGSYMYISEILIKNFISNELQENTLWLINALKGEKKLSIYLGSNQNSGKRRPFVVVKINHEKNTACVIFFSSQHFYFDQVSFNLKDNCTNQCKFTFLENAYVYNNHKKQKCVFAVSKDYFDFDLVEHCGECKNIDYLYAKLKPQVDSCK
jgi:hypothetical protein